MQSTNSSKPTASAYLMSQPSFFHLGQNVHTCHQSPIITARPTSELASEKALSERIMQIPGMECDSAVERVFDHQSRLSSMTHEACLGLKGAT